MKDIVIILNAREAFALTHAGIGKKGRRKLFGALGLTARILEEMKKVVSASEYEALKNEWLSLAGKPPEIKIAPKKLKKYIAKDF